MTRPLSFDQSTEAYKPVSHPDRDSERWWRTVVIVLHTVTVESHLMSD